MPDKNPSDSPNQQDMPLIEHLLELRDRLLKIVLTIGLIFLALFSFANKLFYILSEPLQSLLPEGSSMVAIDVASPFLTPFKLTMVLSIFLAVPVILYHVWAFIAPGLYKHEKVLAFPLLISSTLLFYLGIIFCYFVVFPLLFAFMSSVTPDGVTMMTDISRYLDFVLKMFFAFGIAFEVPIATILLVWVGIVTPESLREKRPYIIVAAFFIGMLMTPPDLISQTLLALPVWFLFEVGLFFSTLIVNKKKTMSEEE